MLKPKRCTRWHVCSSITMPTKPLVGAPRRKPLKKGLMACRNGGSDEAVRSWGGIVKGAEDAAATLKLVAANSK